MVEDFGGEERSRMGIKYANGQRSKNISRHKSIVSDNPIQRSLGKRKTKVFMFVSDESRHKVKQKRKSDQRTHTQCRIEKSEFLSQQDTFQMKYSFERKKNVAVRMG